MEYRIELTPLALEMIAAIQDKREKQGIIERLQKLKLEPLQQGKPLTGDLKGFYSVRAVGQRFRIVFQVKADQVLVIVVGVGRRKEGDKKDVYTLLKKILGD
ncbi:MAG: type II toxin-antitoxin system RelE/ParE family toxin [Thermosynechococcaceae cyanobacterium MS004]|nr:type II toxin-antitoxin system RelE/ParE family toxin [Thermosynechococcaceae cyanobacterium MS004]